MTNISANQRKQSPYGNVYKLGNVGNHRIGYMLVDGTGKVAGKISVSENNAKKFEQAYIDIRRYSPEVHEYSQKVRTEDGIKKIRRRSIGIGLLGGFIGTAIPLALTKNKSKAVKISSTVAGLLVGLVGGFIAAVRTSVPKAVVKTLNAMKSLGEIDIQPYSDDK